MAKTVPIGTKIQYSSSLATALTITAATNANPCVMTLSSATTIAVGDWVTILTNGWGEIVNGVYRIAAVSTNNVTIEGLDTTSTTRFPAGQGTGTLAEITWADVPQVSRDGTSITPGQPRFADASDLTDRVDREIPAGASVDQITIAAHYDPALAAFSALRTYSDNQSVVPFRFIHPAGDTAAFSAYVFVPTLPSLDPGQTRKLNISLRAAGPSIVYTT